MISWLCSAIDLLGGRRNDQESCRSSWM
ncbi:hypothetical protein LINPERPRIM_LOCUS6097 [Linum perenne]